MQGCSFTGHRIIPQAETQRLRGLLDRAIEYAYISGCRSFYCGGAVGFDTLAAHAVLEKRKKYADIRLVLLLPCLSQAKGWRRRDVDTYEQIKASADAVIYVSLEYDGGCMKRRNERLAAECDMLVAYVGRSDSGSAQTLRMAQALGKEIYNLYSRGN